MFLYFRAILQIQYYNTIHNNTISSRTSISLFFRIDANSLFLVELYLDVDIFSFTEENKVSLMCLIFTLHYIYCVISAVLNDIWFKTCIAGKHVHCMGSTFPVRSLVICNIEESIECLSSHILHSFHLASIIGVSQNFPSVFWQLKLPKPSVIHIIRF